jgi:hypothetical protein
VAKKTDKKPKKKTGALADAARKKLSGIGPAQPTPEHVAHVMLHAEEDGSARRVFVDDERWVWVFPGPDGKQHTLMPTPEMLAALERFETEGHPTH